jgi:hypothetical protein
MVFLERLTVNQLIKKFLAFMEPGNLSLHGASSLKCYSVGQEIPFLWNLKVHYHVQKFSQLDPILSQLNPAHINILFP